MLNYETCEIVGGIKLKSSDIIILEGLWALANESLNSKATLKVYIDIDDDTQLCRRIYRDVHERNRSKEEAIEKYFKQVKPMQENFVRPTIINADIVIGQNNFDIGIAAGNEKTIAPNLKLYHYFR